MFARLESFFPGIFAAALFAAAGLSMAQSGANRPADPWAREQEVVVRSATGADLLRVKVEFLGHQAPPGFRAISTDPEKTQHDFYKRTLTNLTTSPIRFTSQTIRSRFGTATVAVAKPGEAHESWGAAVKLDIAKTPVVRDNLLAPGRFVTSQHYVQFPRDRQALEVTVGFEHESVSYEIGYNLVYIAK